MKGITKKNIAHILDFTWIDNHHNLLFFGPPGLGKTHLSIALGIKAVESGYTVCFERITSLIKILKMSEIQRSSGFRLKRILKSDLIIIDEIGYNKEGIPVHHSIEYHPDNIMNFSIIRRRIN